MTSTSAHASPARAPRHVSLFNGDGSLSRSGIRAIEIARERGLNVAELSEADGIRLLRDAQPAVVRVYVVQTSVQTLDEINDDEPGVNFVPVGAQPTVVAEPAPAAQVALEVDAPPASRSTLPRFLDEDATADAPVAEAESTPAVVLAPVAEPEVEVVALELVWEDAGPPAPAESEVPVVETEPEPVVAAPVLPARPAPAHGKWKDATPVRAGLRDFVPAKIVSRPEPKPTVVAAPVTKPWQKPAAPAVAQKPAKVAQPPQPKAPRVNPQTALEAAFAQARQATPSMVQTTKGKGGAKGRNERKQAKGKAGK